MTSDVFPALAVFVKTPGLSALKTRLALAWGEKQTLDFYGHCLGCCGELLFLLQTAGWDVSWAVAESGGLDDPRWKDFAVLAQGQTGLGARMAHVLNVLLGRRPTAIILGSDSPQVNPSHLDQARKYLEGDADVVLGPAADGGFWLLGTKVALPGHVLDAVTYSGPETRAEFIRSLRGWNPELRIVDSLPVLRDVDTEADAKALVPELCWGKAQEDLAKWLTSPP